MPTNRRALCAQKRAESTKDVNRYVELRVDFTDWEGEPLFAVGGLWDRKKKKYISDGSTARVFRLHAGQYEACNVFCEWLRKRLANLTLTLPNGQALRSLLLLSGRRAGKTDFACRAAVAYAIAFPRSRVWLVSPAIPETEELDLNLKEFLPRSWYTRLGAPWYRYKLANGSVIILRSAHDPTALKRGRADFVVVNEAQKIQRRAFSILRGATADKGGLIMLTSNPPDEAIGQWIADFVEQAEAGRRPSKVVYLNARLNPVVDQGSLDDMQFEMSEREYRMERDGELLGNIAVAMHAWSQTYNVRSIPADAKDITTDFCKRTFNKEADYIAGFDFQLHPYMASTFFKVYENPADASNPFLWAVDYFSTKGNEEELIDEMENDGYDGSRVVCVLDASGFWQGSEAMGQNRRWRSDKRPIRGRASAQIFKERGWIHLVKPDPESDRNPEITERVAAANWRICNGKKQRFVYSVPENTELNEAIRKWETKNGIPWRNSQFVHLCDSFTYVIFRLYPRRKKREKFTYEKVPVPDRGGWEKMAS